MVTVLGMLTVQEMVTILEMVTIVGPRDVDYPGIETLLKYVSLCL